MNKPSRYYVVAIQYKDGRIERFGFPSLKDAKAFIQEAAPIVDAATYEGVSEIQ